MKGVTLETKEEEKKSFYKKVPLVLFFHERQTDSTDILAGKILFEHKQLSDSSLNSIKDY